MNMSVIQAASVVGPNYFVTVRPDGLIVAVIPLTFGRARTILANRQGILDGW